MRAVVRETYYPNPDGSARAHIIRKYCKVGSRIEIEPEPDNPKDPNSVAVYLLVGRLLLTRRFQIGYLKAATAEHFKSGPKRLGKVIKFHAPIGDNSPMVLIQIQE